MGIPVLILGESGSGKSASLRNFEENEIGIFNVAGKPLPFRKKLNKIDNAKYTDIVGRLKLNKLKAYVKFVYEGIEFNEEIDLGKYNKTQFDINQFINEHIEDKEKAPC